MIVQPVVEPMDRFTALDISLAMDGARSQQPVSRTTDLDTVNVKAADTHLSFHGTSG